MQKNWELNEVLTTPQVSEELGSCTLIQLVPVRCAPCWLTLLLCETMEGRFRTRGVCHDDGQMPNGHAVKARHIGTHDPIVYTYHTYHSCTRVQKIINDQVCKICKIYEEMSIFCKQLHFFGLFGAFKCVTALLSVGRMVELSQRLRYINKQQLNQHWSIFALSVVSSPKKCQSLEDHRGRKYDKSKLASRDRHYVATNYVYIIYNPIWYIYILHIICVSYFMNKWTHII